MNNVINLFTREPINIEPSLIEQYASTWLEPIARLAVRFGRKSLDDVLLTPKMVTRNDALVIRTYQGNVHTNKGMLKGWPLPLPYDIREYSKHIYKYEHLILEDECFMYMDRKYKVTLRLLKDIAKCPSKNLKSITIRTRSDLFAHDSYLEPLEVLKVLGIDIKFNLYGMTISEATNKKQWPGAPSVKRRERALSKAIDRLKLRLKVVEGV